MKRLHTIVAYYLRLWQEAYEGYQKTDICAALLALCPPDSATLGSHHQDQTARMQHTVLRAMIPAGKRPETPVIVVSACRQLQLPYCTNRFYSCSDSGVKAVKQL